MIAAHVAALGVLEKRNAKRREEDPFLSASFSENAQLPVGL
jgi:hypothetical protein